MMVKKKVQRKGVKKEPKLIFSEWENIFEAIGHPAIILNPQHKVIAANRASIKLTGRSSHEIIGKRCYEIFHSKDTITPPEGCPMEKMLKSGQLETTEMELEALGGIFLVSCTPVLDKQGKLEKVIHIATDITERKKAEGALKVSEDKFRSLAEQSITGITLIQDGKFVYVNPRLAEIFGFQQEEMIGLPVLDLVAESDREMVRENFRKRLSGEVPSLSYSFQALKKDGSEGAMEVYGRTATHNGLPAIMGTLMDVTERKKAEEKLREFNDTLQAIIAASPLAILVLDKEGKVMKWSPAGERIFGWSEQEVLGRFNPIVPEDKIDEFRANFSQIIRGEIFTREARRQKKDGSLIDIIISTAPLRNATGNIIGAVGVMQDISERKRVEEALFYSEKKFRNLLETIQLVAVMLDLNGNITFCNDYLLNLTGWTSDEVLNKNWFDMFIPEEHRDEIKSVFKSVISSGAFPLHYENPIITREGSKEIIVWDNAVLRSPDGNIIGTASIGINVTEHRKLEEQFRQAQKMEAFGSFAGGVAHDFNNILTAIIGYSELLKSKIPDTDPLNDYVNQILVSSEKASNLTHSLLAFSRKQIIAPKPVNINDIISGMQKILDRIIGENIDIKVHIAGRDLIVSADKGQIEHALINLATNARDAMQDGGTLTITTEEAEIDDQFIRMHQYGETGRFAVILFSDTGMGMDKKTKEHIFEPFFTTKEVGKGTGLGLAMVFGTIKQHNGFINVYSEPGRGTTVKIYLPLIESVVQLTQEKAPASDLSGSETILLVEDDESVRHITKIMLEDLGYKVIEAIDGEHAIEVFKKNKDSIQLILSDVIMPKKSGKDMQSEIQKIKFNVKVLFISGYSRDELAKKGMINKGINFLSKPVKPEELFRKIREILDK